MGIVYDLSYVGLPILLFALLEPAHGVAPFAIWAYTGSC